MGRGAGHYFVDAVPGHGREVGTYLSVLLLSKTVMYFVEVESVGTYLFMLLRQVY